MLPLKTNLPWKMKVMRVEVKISTYPLLSNVLLEYTMFPAMTTFPLTQSLPTAQVPANHITRLFDISYPSIPLMMKTVPQMIFHLPAPPCHHRISWVMHS